MSDIGLGLAAGGFVEGFETGENIQQRNRQVDLAEREFDAEQFNQIFDQSVKTIAQAKKNLEIARSKPNASASAIQEAESGLAQLQQVVKNVVAAGAKSIGQNPDPFTASIDQAANAPTASEVAQAQGIQEGLKEGTSQATQAKTLEEFAGVGAEQAQETAGIAQPSERFGTLTPSQKTELGIPPGAFAQINQETGRVEVESVSGNRSDLLSETGEVKNEVSNTIVKSAAQLFEGFVNPVTGEISIDNAEDRKQVLAIARNAERLIQTGQATSTSDAVSRSARNFGIDIPQNGALPGVTSGNQSAVTDRLQRLPSGSRFNGVNDEGVLEFTLPNGNVVGLQN